jgi:hypothetical protein
MIILILILILTVFYFKSKNDWYRLWKNGFEDFPLEEFFNKFGDYFVLLTEYTVDGQPDLISSNHFSIKLKDWKVDNEIFNGNRQTKISFFNNSKNPIAKFIINWVENNKYLLGTNFRNKDYCCSLRISRNRWEYPSHFDAVDNFTFILSGSRNVILNEKINSKKIKLNLNKNDILFFRNGVYHHFWCHENNQLNIVLNIVFDPDNKHISNKFDKKYPKRIEELNEGLEFI